MFDTVIAAHVQPYKIQWLVYAATSQKMKEDGLCAMV